MVDSLLETVYQVRENLMSTLDDAKMPSLKDKILAQAEAVEKQGDKEDIEFSKGKGRIKKSKTKNK